MFLGWGFNAGGGAEPHVPNDTQNGLIQQPAADFGSTNTLDSQGHVELLCMLGLAWRITCMLHKYFWCQLETLIGLGEPACLKS